MAISKFKSWYDKLKGPKGVKPMVVYHLGPDKIYKFRPLASFRGQAGLYVSPSIRSIFNDWYQTLISKKDYNKAFSKLYLHQILIDQNLYNQIQKDFYQQGKSDNFKQGFGFWGWGQQTFIPAKYLDRLKIISIKQYTFQQARKIINYNQDIVNSNANKKMNRQWQNNAKRQPITVEKHIINKNYINKDGTIYRQQNSVVYNCPKLNINNLYNQNKLRQILIKNNYFVSYTKDIFQGKKYTEKQNQKQKDWIYYFRGSTRVLGKIKIKSKVISYIFN